MEESSTKASSPSSSLLASALTTAADEVVAVVVAIMTVTAVAGTTVAEDTIAGTTTEAETLTGTGTMTAAVGTLVAARPVGTAEVLQVAPAEAHRERTEEARRLVTADAAAPDRALPATGTESAAPHAAATVTTIVEGTMTTVTTIAEAATTTAGRLVAAAPTETGTAQGEMTAGTVLRFMQEGKKRLSCAGRTSRWNTQGQAPRRLVTSAAQTREQEQRSAIVSHIVR